MIEKLVADAKKQVEGFGYSEQWELLTETARRLEDLGHEALVLEYMIEDMEGGEE